MLMPNHTVTVYSLSGSGLKRQYTNTVAENVAIYIYDTEEIIDTVNGAIGRQEIRAITDYMSIEENHKIVDENSKVYMVKKVRVKISPINKHLELVLSADYGTPLSD